MYMDEEKTNNYGSNKFIREVRENSPMLSNSIVQAYYSSGSFNKIGYMEFVRLYLEDLKKTREMLDSYELEEKEEDKIYGGRSL